MRTLLLVALLSLSCRAHRTTASSANAPLRESLTIDGRERTFLIWEPAGDGQHPLLLSLHGRYGTAEGEEMLTNGSHLAATSGVLVVAPEGVEKSWADARGVTPASQAGVDDVRFLNALIDRMLQKHDADPTRVYVMGMSNGAMMALTLACRLTDRLAGVMAVAGLMTPPLEESCHPATPLSVALIAGEDDPVVPYKGGAVSDDRGAVLSANASAEFWAKANGCGRAEVIELADRDPDDGTRTVLKDWVDCRDNTDVRLYTVLGGGHTWPHGWQYLGKWLIGATSQDFSATDEAWRFLQDHRRTQ